MAGTVIQGSFPRGYRDPRIALPDASPVRPTVPRAARTDARPPRRGGTVQPHSAHKASAPAPRPHAGAFQLTRNRASLRTDGGHRLPEPVRRRMESVLKAGLSDVRIHIGSDADAIGALAFTHGSNIYFARGQYNPHSAQGQRLIGHELAHVLQQRTGRVMNPFGSGVAVVQDKMLEAEADRLGRLAVMQHRVAQQDGAQGLSGARTPRLAQGCLARPSTAGRSASAGPFWMIARRSRSIGSVVQRAEPQRAFGYTKDTGEAAKQFTSFFGQI